jgi:hypothetical protein
MTKVGGGRNPHPHKFELNGYNSVRGNYEKEQVQSLLTAGPFSIVFSPLITLVATTGRATLCVLSNTPYSFFGCLHKSAQKRTATSYILNPA